MSPTRLFHFRNAPKSDSSKPLLGSLGPILFFILAFSFLAYKLLAFNHYTEFITHWKQMPLSQFWWLAAVFALLPANWFLESIKWKMLTAHVQKISFRTSIKAVLGGASTGFITPNRVGEMVGRVMFLDSENRKAGVTLSVLNSLTQSLIMTLCGVPACILFLTLTGVKIEINKTLYLIIMFLCLLILGAIYFRLPQLSQRFKRSRFSEKVKAFTDFLTNYNWKDLLRIMVVSLSRYFVFSLQFFLMLRFFGIELTGWQALIAIPTTYLFVTFTPSLAFSEVAVRSSYAVLVIGAFSGQVVSIVLAGVGIWMVNFVIPVLAGSVILLKKNS